MEAPQLRVGPGQGQAAPRDFAVRQATDADALGIVTMLARAYYRDPVYRWTFADDACRLQQLRQVFGLFGRQIFAYEETYTTDEIAGAALWLPPDRWRMCPYTRVAVVHGLVAGPGVGCLPRALRSLYLMQSRHPREPSHPYLAFIGVEPERQGEGVGTALMQPMLARCDREGWPVYLEATTPRNVAFFERNGFEVGRPIGLHRGPLMWPMWRRPG